MGAKNLFRNESPDFSDFTTTHMGVDEILHSAKIEADEKGITAAAGTVQLLFHYSTNLIHSFLLLSYRNYEECFVGYGRLYSYISLQSTICICNS